MELACVLHNEDVILCLSLLLQARFSNESFRVNILLLGSFSGLDEGVLDEVSLEVVIGLRHHFLQAVRLLLLVELCLLFSVHVRQSFFFGQFSKLGNDRDIGCCGDVECGGVKSVIA